MYNPTYITSTAPTVNDDYDDGYRNGNFWWDTDTQTLYVLTDHTVGAASWDSITSSAISAWTTWTPTLSWTGNTPTGVSYVARYQQIGAFICFTLDITGTNDVGANITDLTVSLPVQCRDNDNLIPVSFIYDINGSYAYNSPSYIDGTDNTPANRILKHASFPTIAASLPFNLYYRAFYEEIP